MVRIGLFTFPFAFAFALAFGDDEVMIQTKTAANKGVDRMADMTPILIDTCCVNN